MPKSPGAIYITRYRHRLFSARAHLPAIAAFEEAELVAVCTAHEETAKRAQQRTGARLAFWDYREMMRSPEVDMVTVAVRIA